MTLPQYPPSQKNKPNQTNPKDLPWSLISTQPCPVPLIPISAKYLASVTSKPRLHHFNQVQVDFAITPPSLTSSLSVTACYQMKRVISFFSSLASWLTPWSLLNHLSSWQLLLPICSPPSQLLLNLMLTQLLHPTSAPRLSPQISSRCFVHSLFRWAHSFHGFKYYSTIYVLLTFKMLAPVQKVCLSSKMYIWMPSCRLHLDISVSSQHDIPWLGI